MSQFSSWPGAGVGSEIAALMMEHAFDYLDAPVIRVAAKDVPLPYAANLEKLALPQVEDIIEAVKRVFAESGTRLPATRWVCRPTPTPERCSVRHKRTSTGVFVSAFDPLPSWP